LQSLANELVRLMDALLGGAAGEDNQGLAGQLGRVADALAQLVDGILGALLGASGEAPGPANAPSSPVAFLVESLAANLARFAEAFYHALPWQLAAGPGAQLDPSGTNPFLVDLGATTASADPSSYTQGAPTAPAQTPTVPSTPPSSGGPSPSSGFATGASGAFASGNGAGTGVWLVLGAGASLAIILRGGRPPWASYVLLKPTSAMRLAIERPG
jgi:hypothetical protein